MSESNGNGKPKSRKISHPKKRVFLKTMAETFNVCASAKAAGINPRTHYDWMANDPEYPVQFAEAKAIGADALEAELTRRAKEGNRKYKFHNGKPQMVRCSADHEDAIEVVKEGKPYYVRHYYEVEQSDVLGIFLMKGAKPEKYRERYEVKDHVDDDELNRDIQRRLDQLATRKASTLPGATGSSGSSNGNGAER